MQDEQVQARMIELMKPIDEAIKTCTSVEDTLMLASVMLTTSVQIFTLLTSKEDARAFFEEIVNN